ncbi:MAG TPA: hypothetical protein VH561_10570 [Micromonosporaceae bacterium]
MAPSAFLAHHRNTVIIHQDHCVAAAGLGRANAAQCSGRAAIGSPRNHSAMARSNVLGPDVIANRALAVHTTGFHRPEDYTFDEARLAGGSIRMCGNNTGRKQAHYYGETMCLTDGAVADATTNSAVPQGQVLIVGSPEYNMRTTSSTSRAAGTGSSTRTGRPRSSGRTTTIRGRAWTTGHHGPDQRRVSADCLAQRPELGVNRRLLRRQRQALLRQRAAQQVGARHPAGHHRLALTPPRK